MKLEINQLIEKYNLKKHPEGGYFAETYRSGQMVDSPVNREKRNAVTDIYFLLPAGEISRFHKVIHDEIWNFYEGDPLKIIKFDGEKLTEHIIGPDCKDGYKLVIEGGIWQAAVTTGKYSLAGCTVAPGFDFTDFSFLSDNAKLADIIRNQFPEYEYLI